jgi:fructan beta-fructosidase
MAICTFTRSILPLVLLLLTASSGLFGQSDSLRLENYKERHRPQFHFSPVAHWMNDPNGLCWFEGEYHLFYQYYPAGIVWGPMHWGHAVSSDMVRWKHLPVAIYPDSLGYIFSGSVVIDKDNRSGLGTKEQPPMVAIFTHHDPQGEKEGQITFQNQSIAWSSDKGRTFTKFSGNPVIKNPGIRDFRDPKVRWHEESNRWIMVLAAYDQVMLYSSADLKKWDFCSSFGIPGDTRLWECPDLVPVRTRNSDEKKWVLLVSIQNSAPNGGTATAYFVGDFDGRTFKSDPTFQQWLDYGTDNYAMVTWSNVPDDRILALGWMSNWQYAQQVPTEQWRSAMTLPRELTLHKNDGGFRLHSAPVAELRTLQNSDAPDLATGIRKPGLIYSDCTLSRLTLTMPVMPTADLAIRYSNDDNQELIVGYDRQKNAFYVDRSKAGQHDFSPTFAGRHYSGQLPGSFPFSMEIFLDHASVELFGQQGSTVMTEICFPSKPFSKAELVCHPEDVSKCDMKAWRLNRVWK